MLLLIPEREIDINKELEASIFQLLSESGPLSVETLLLPLVHVYCCEGSHELCCSPASPRAC
jgi:hypothetical protein